MLKLYLQPQLKMQEFLGDFANDKASGYPNTSNAGALLLSLNSNVGNLRLDAASFFGMKPLETGLSQGVLSALSKAGINTSTGGLLSGGLLSGVSNFGKDIFKNMGGASGLISMGGNVVNSLLPEATLSKGLKFANNILSFAENIPVYGKFATLAKLGLNTLNTAAGHTIKSLNNDQGVKDTLAGTAGGYGDFMNSWDEASKYSGKRAGFFDGNKYDRMVEAANRQMNVLQNVIEKKSIGDILTALMGDRWNERTLMDLNGGPGNISFGRLGLKVEILPKVHAILNKPKVLDTLKEWKENKNDDGDIINSFLEGGKTFKNNEKQIKERLFKEWPVLSNIEFHIVPDPNFTIENTGVGSIEYFSPEEKEYMHYPNGFKYKNPYLGEASIIYNPNDNDYEDIKMDLLHALRVQDPKYRALVNEIDKTVLEGDDDLRSNARLRYDEDLKKYGKEYMPFENYVLNEVDGLLRNLFYNGSSEVLKSKRYYPNKETLKKWNKHLMPYIQKIEAYLNGTQAFKQGGQMNVIPEGSLHARLHHMENADGLTKKGIPVVSIAEGGELELQAEIELNEIIFNLEVTTELEKLMKDGSDSAAIEAGKLLVKEIFENTDDRTGLIKLLEPEKKEPTTEDIVKNHQVFKNGGIIEKINGLSPEQLEKLTKFLNEV